MDSLAVRSRNVRLIEKELGAGHVMIGRSYPFDMGDADPVGSLATAGLHPDARGGIGSWGGRCPSLVDCVTGTGAGIGSWGSGV